MLKINSLFNNMNVPRNNGIILLTNPLFINMFEYVNDINKLNNKYEFHVSYTTFDKSKDDIVHFKCDNIKTFYKSQNNLIVKVFKYDNSLEFSFNKRTNEIYIYKVPTYEYNNIKLPIFTSDVTSIITKIINKYADIKDIVITFSDSFSPLVINNNVKEILPSIIKTNNYNITQKIFIEIKKELEIINKIIKSYKSHQDAIIQKQEKIYEIRRKIYGVDPIYYNTIDELYEAVNLKIKEKIEHILKKIDRHLISTKNAYKKILWNQFTTMYNKKYETNFNIKELQDFLKRNKDNSLTIITLFFDNYADILNCDNKLSSAKNNFEVLEILINEMFDYDLNNKNGLLSRIIYIRENYLKHLSSDEKHQGKNNLYTYYLYDFENNHPIDFFGGEYNYHSIFKKEYIDKYLHSNSNIFKAIDLVDQYGVLLNDKKYYSDVLNDLSKVTIDFNKTVNTYGELINLPYWFREEKYTNSQNPNCYDLLMIKPNCTFIDINKIINFKKVSGYKGRNKYNLNLTNSPRYIDKNMKVSSDDRICITIPKSLDINAIKTILDNFYHRYESTYFICEDFTTFIVIKNYLINIYFEELKKKIEDNSNFENDIYHESKRSFICVDPNYYNTFFATTPSNHIFYHLYDYTSNYKFRRNSPLCIEDLIELYTNREKEININVIKDYILGSYNSKDEEKLSKNRIDEFKYCALTYVFDYLNKRINQKGFSKNNKILLEMEKVIAHFDKIELVIKEKTDEYIVCDEEYSTTFNEVYRELDFDELTDIFKKGAVNVEVALYKNNIMYIWKNFPYTPAEIINKEKLLKYSRKLKIDYDLDLPLPF